MSQTSIRFVGVMLLAMSTPICYHIHRSSQDETTGTVIATINTHEKPDIMRMQLENIAMKVKATEVRVLLNCNDYMLTTLSSIELPPYAAVNPTPINKKRFHGSITQGIVANLRLAAEQEFDHFLILSASSKLALPLSIRNIRAGYGMCKKHVQNSCLGQLCRLSHCGYIRTWPHAKKNGPWLFGAFATTALGKHVLAQKGKLIGSRHEGLVIDRATGLKILKFLDEHPDIADDLYNTKMPLKNLHCRRWLTLLVVTSRWSCELGLGGARKDQHFCPLCTWSGSRSSGVYVATRYARPGKKVRGVVGTAKKCVLNSPSAAAGRGGGVAISPIDAKTSHAKTPSKA